MDTLPSCLSCGTCCFSELERYVPVSGDDHARLGDDAERLVAFDGHRAFMCMEGGHCAALVVDAAARQLVCSVYERRPAVCRELERGGPSCEAERARKGELPLIVLGRQGLRSAT